MLTLEKIKKGCEFAEGYEYREESNNNIVVRFINKPWVLNYNIDADAWVYGKYGDFLQRVIEGINKTGEYLIDIEYHNKSWGWRIFEGDYCDEDSFLEMGKDSDIDQAKEQSINYIFDKMEKTYE